MAVYVDDLFISGNSDALIVRNPESSAGDTDDSKSEVVHLDTISMCSIDVVEDTDTDPEHGDDEEGAEAFHPRDRLSADQASRGRDRKLSPRRIK